MEILFQTPNCCFLAEFNQNLTAEEIIKHIPLDAKVRVWGDEIYFKTTISTLLSSATREVNSGDIAYWPEEKSICVFFGPTPLSRDAKPVPASPVVIIGKTKTDPAELKKIESEHPIRVTLVDGAETYQKSAEAERKLTQDEIDILVKQLLAEQKKKPKN